MYALDFRVQASDDGTASVDPAARSNETTPGNTGHQVVDLDEQHSRYVRIRGGRRVGAAPQGRRQEPCPGPHPAEDDSPPGNAVDGDPRQVGLGALDQIEIRGEQAYAREFAVQVSADGWAWTDVKVMDNTATELTISVNGAPART